jgi:hypothetical protein
MKRNPPWSASSWPGWNRSGTYSRKARGQTIDQQIHAQHKEVHLEEAWHTLATQTEIPPYASVTQLQGQSNLMAEDQPDLAKFDAKTMVDNSVIKKLADSGWIKKVFR